MPIDNQNTKPRLLRAEEVIKLLGISRISLNRMVKAGAIKRYKLSANISVFKEDELDEFIANLERSYADQGGDQ